MEIPEPKFTLNQIVTLKNDPTAYLKITVINFNYFAKEWFYVCEKLNDDRTLTYSELSLCSLGLNEVGPTYYTLRNIETK